ncbi:LysR substrate-binding domain-containing protein, partial [Streptomyces sp. NPDC004561]
DVQLGGLAVRRPVRRARRQYGDVDRARPQGPLHATPLTDEEFVLVAAPVWAGRVARRLAAEGPAALHEVPLITYAEDLPIARRYWRHVFGRRLSRTAAVTVPDLRGVLAAVAAGAGFSVLPRYLCQDLLESGAVVALLEPEDPPINTGFLVRRPGASDNADVVRVSELLLRAARSW